MFYIPDHYLPLFAMCFDDMLRIVEDATQGLPILEISLWVLLSITLYYAVTSTFNLFVKEDKDGNFHI